MCGSDWELFKWVYMIINGQAPHAGSILSGLFTQQPIHVSRMSTQFQIALVLRYPRFKREHITYFSPMDTVQ